MPRKEELVDLKELIPVSPKLIQEESHWHRNRNQAQNRLLSQPILKSNKVSETLTSLNNQLKKVKDDHQSVSSHQIYNQGQIKANSTNNFSPNRSHMSDRLAKNSQAGQSFAEVLQEYKIEGRTLD